MPGLLNQIPAWIDKLRSFSYGHPDLRQRRLQRAGLTGLATLFSRGVTVLAGLATLPITSYYLGKERFGLWLTLSSLIGWIIIADLGIAVSLINALSIADGQEDKITARRAVANAFWMTSTLAVVVILAGLLITGFVDWTSLFNLKTALAIAEAEPSITVLIILCALRLPSSIVSCTYQAYQEGYIYQLWNGLGGIASAGGLVAAVLLNAGLPWLVGAYLGGLLLTDILAGAYLFGYRRSWLVPTFGALDRSQSVWLIKKGAQFWIAQISTALIFQIDILIVARLFGVSEVSVYGTTLRLFGLLGAVQIAFLMPLWAAYGEASARRDWIWVSHTFKNSIKYSLLWATPAAVSLAVLMPYIFRLLVTSDLNPDVKLTLTMMVTEVINSVARCISIFLNGLGAIRSQAIVGPVAGIANVFLSLELGRRMGPLGVSLATAICVLIFWIGILGNESRYRLKSCE